MERIIDPIQSRCQSFQIVPPSKKEVAVHLSTILTNEDVKFISKAINEAEGSETPVACLIGSEYS